jgi:hypothetical protein
MKEALSSSETSHLTRATQRNIPEDTILHSHRRENLKFDTNSVQRIMDGRLVEKQTFSRREATYVREATPARSRWTQKSCISLPEIAIFCYCPLAQILVSLFFPALSDPITSPSSDCCNIEASLSLALSLSPSTRFRPLARSWWHLNRSYARGEQSTSTYETGRNSHQRSQPAATMRYCLGKWALTCYSCMCWL